MKNDSDEKGIRKGTQIHTTTLKESDIVDIRAAREDGEFYGAIASRYDMSAEQIRRICNRKAWKHVK